MRKRIIAALIACISLSCSTCIASDVMAPKAHKLVQRDLSKLHNAKDTLNALRQVLELAEESKEEVLSSSSDAEPYKRVDKIVDSYANNPVVLANLAAIARGLAYPQRAEDVYIDLYFDRTFWQCVYRLGSAREAKSREALDQLSGMIKPLEGTDRVRFNSIGAEYKNHLR
jgi:hypothetical protein